jgi:hypothetical protein
LRAFARAELEQTVLRAAADAGPGLDFQADLAANAAFDVGL